MLFQNDPVVNSVFNRLAGDEISRGYQTAAMDAYRRGSDVWVHIDLPGVPADSLDVSVERNVLTVTAERWWQRQDGDHFYAQDRRQGRIRRQVHLGDGLDVDAIEADYRDGVLTLRLPIAEKAKPRKISVQVSSPVVDVETSAAVEANEAELGVGVDSSETA